MRFNLCKADYRTYNLVLSMQEQLGWRPLVAAWLKRQSKCGSVGLQPCFEMYMEKMLDQARYWFNDRT